MFPKTQTRKLRTVMPALGISGGITYEQGQIGAFNQYVTVVEADDKEHRP
jgi:hypothetical protein